MKAILATVIFTVVTQNISISQQCQASGIQAEINKKTDEHQNIPARYRGRENLDEDMPLKDALLKFNRYQSEPKLTEEEIIASVRRIKAEHPTIQEDVLAIYQRVIDEKILPKGMDFRTISGWKTDGYYYEVDWRDLWLDAEHSCVAQSFNHRIRSRLISSRPLTEEEELLSKRPIFFPTEQFMVDGKLDEEKMKSSREYKEFMKEFEEFQKELDEFHKQQQGN